MYTLLTGLWQQLTAGNQYNILILGPQRSGKSTLFNILKQYNIKTSHNNYQSLVYNPVSLALYESSQSPVTTNRNVNNNKNNTQDNKASSQINKHESNTTGTVTSTLNTSTLDNPINPKILTSKNISPKVYNAIAAALRSTSLYTQTIGLNAYKTTLQEGLAYQLWDLGGEKKLRSLWQHYFLETHCIIFVLDTELCLGANNGNNNNGENNSDDSIPNINGNNTKQQQNTAQLANSYWNDVRAELHTLLTINALLNVPIIIICNQSVVNVNNLYDIDTKLYNVAMKIGISHLLTQDLHLTPNLDGTMNSNYIHTNNNNNNTNDNIKNHDNINKTDVHNFFHNNASRPAKHIPSSQHHTTIAQYCDEDIDIQPIDLDVLNTYSTNTNNNNSGGSNVGTTTTTAPTTLSGIDYPYPISPNTLSLQNNTQPYGNMNNTIHQTPQHLFLSRHENTHQIKMFLLPHIDMQMFHNPTGNIAPLGGGLDFGGNSHSQNRSQQRVPSQWEQSATLNYFINTLNNILQYSLELLPTTQRAGLILTG